MKSPEKFFSGDHVLLITVIFVIFFDIQLSIDTPHKGADHGINAIAGIHIEVIINSAV